MLTDIDLARPRSRSSAWVRLGTGARRAWGRAIWLLPAMIPALLFLPIVLAPPLNHDVAAVLDFSRRWLAGEGLYTDLIDVNPPLIFVLNLIPAGIARLSGLDPVHALQACLMAWGLVAWWLSVKVRARAAEGLAERALLDVLPLYFLLAGGYDFGQREHLMAVAALPYLLAAARREGGVKAGRWMLAAAVFAAVGFALKPYFLAIPALAELAVLTGRWRERRNLYHALRETLASRTIWVMTAVWEFYLASLPLVFPAYLGQVVPLVWGYYLDLGGLSVWQVLLTSRLACIEILLAAMMGVVLRHRLEPGLATARMFLAAAIGALASALAQHKGWSYHVVPVEHMAIALALWMAVHWLDLSGADLRGRRAVHVAAALGGAFGLYVISNGEAPWTEIDYRGSPAQGLTALLRQYAAGKAVMVFSPGIYPVFPAVNYAHARMTLASMNMWLIEGAYQTCLPDGRRYRDASEMGAAEGQTYRRIVDSFTTHPPAALVVDKQPGIPWCGSEFDFLAYFQRDPRFRAAFASYREVAEWDRYRVYVRPD